MRRELTQRLGKQVVAPPRPALPSGNVLSKELISEAAYLLVSTQFGSPQMIERELKTTKPILAYAMAFLQGAKIIGPGEGDEVRAVLWPARRAEEVRRLLLEQIPAYLARDAEANVGPQDKVPLELLMQAAELVISSQFAVSRMLQQKLKVEPATADRLLRALHTCGAVGPPELPGVRSVLVRPEKLRMALAQLADDGKVHPER
jgi:DNA segregation ATPase FtsK/SpoIIIE-like protein